MVGTRVESVQFLDGIPTGSRVRIVLHPAAGEFTGIFPGKMSSAAVIIGWRTRQTLRLNVRSVNTRRLWFCREFLTFRNRPWHGLNNRTEYSEKIARTDCQRQIPDTPVFPLPET